MKFFIDTEFHEYETARGVPTIELISIGIVAEDGRELYEVSRDFDVEAAFCNDWLRENVLRPIWEPGDTQGRTGLAQLRNTIANIGKSRLAIKHKIIDFISPDGRPVDAEFYGYYADYDWVVFCWLFGRMIDLPENFPMYCRDLKQMFDEYVELNDDERDPPIADALKAHPNYPKQEDEHNALADARWNKALYEFLFTEGL